MGKISSSLFYQLAKALAEDKTTTYDDIETLIEQTLVSCNEEYLDGLKLLWMRRFEIRQDKLKEKDKDYGRGIYS